MTEPASFLADDADVPTLRDAVSKLAGIGYSESRITERLGLEDLTELQWRLVAIYRSQRLAARDPLAIAIDLFLLQGIIPAGELELLFTATERAVLVRAGILAIDETGGARARASLYPVGNRLIFSDHAWPELPHPGYVIVPYDQVMKVGLDSRHLAHCTRRRPVRSALDLCTGSGVHALLASSHTARVLAVDINPRAARCTRFNAAVAGAANLDVVVSDLFEAVRSERFDLITANPPFVPSPVDALHFRDGGRSGEDVQRRIVAGLPRYLAPGGTAQMVTELGERDGEALVDRLREWLDGAPMDIHILRLTEHTAMQYAIGHAKGESFQEFVDSVHEWGTNLLAQGYARVVSLVISFQWTDPACGPPWERVDQAPPPRRAAGAEIDAIFQAERLARRVDADSLKQSLLRRTGPVALLDASMLGSDLHTKTKVTLLGQALTMEHLLDPIEREILIRLENPEFSVFRDLDLDEASVLAAVRSLVRDRLVRTDGPRPA